MFFYKKLQNGPSTQTFLAIVDSREHFDKVLKRYDNSPNYHKYFKSTLQCIDDLYCALNALFDQFSSKCLPHFKGWKVADKAPGIRRKHDQIIMIVYL